MMIKTFLPQLVSKLLIDLRYVTLTIRSSTIRLFLRPLQRCLGGKRDSRKLRWKKVWTKEGERKTEDCVIEIDLKRLLPYVSMDCVRETRNWRGSLSLSLSICISCLFFIHFSTLVYSLSLSIYIYIYHIHTHTISFSLSLSLSLILYLSLSFPFSLSSTIDSLFFCFIHEKASSFEEFYCGRKCEKGKKLKIAISNIKVNKINERKK